MIKLYYSDSTNNFGDLLTPLLFERVFDCKIQRTPYKKARVFGIGSILQKLLVKKTAFLKQCLQTWQPELTIIGSGFIQDIDAKKYCITRRLNPLAVRGRHSLNLLRQLAPCSQNIIIGDLGIFASHLLSKKCNKKYALGIVPHYTEKTHPAVLTLKNKIPHSLFIDVLAPPLVVLEQIAQCETVISSSLHGLIVADSLFIPNKHMLLSGSVIGQGFKFQDYYSNYDLTDEAWTVKELECVGNFPDAIIKSYQIQPSQVESMQQCLSPIKNQLIKPD